MIDINKDWRSELERISKSIEENGFNIRDAASALGVSASALVDFINVVNPIDWFVNGQNSSAARVGRHLQRDVGAVVDRATGGKSQSVLNAVRGAAGMTAITALKALADKVGVDLGFDDDKEGESENQEPQDVQPNKETEDPDMAAEAMEAIEDEASSMGTQDGKRAMTSRDLQSQQPVQPKPTISDMSWKRFMFTEGSKYKSENEAFEAWKQRCIDMLEDLGVKTGKDSDTKAQEYKEIRPEINPSTGTEEVDLGNIDKTGVRGEIQRELNDGTGEVPNIALDQELPGKMTDAKPKDSIIQDLKEELLTHDPRFDVDLGKVGGSVVSGVESLGKGTRDVLGKFESLPSKLKDRLRSATMSRMGRKAFAEDPFAESSTPVDVAVSEESSEGESTDEKEQKPITRKQLMNQLSRRITGANIRGAVGGGVGTLIGALGAIAATDPNTGARVGTGPLDVLAEGIKTGTARSVAQSAGKASQQYTVGEQQVLKQELDDLRNRLMESYSKDSRYEPEQAKAMADRQFYRMYMQMVRESAGQTRNVLRSLWPILHPSAAMTSRRLG